MDVATKAHWFALFEEQTASLRRKPKRRKRPRTVSRKDPVDTSLPLVSATDRRVGRLHTAQRNRARRLDKRGASFDLEDSVERPTRKSTRDGDNRSKPDSNLKRRRTRALDSPGQRATRDAGHDRALDAMIHSPQGRIVRPWQRRPTSQRRRPARRSP